MINKKLLVLILFIISFSFVLYIKDASSLYLFISLAFIFTPLIYLSFKSNNYLLKMVISLITFSHLFGAPLLFIYKEEYSYSGFDAIKNFEITFYNVISLYFNIFLIVLTIIFFIKFIDKILKLNSFHKKFKSKKIKDVFTKRKISSSLINFFIYFLILILILFFYLLYTFKITTMGVEQTIVLPFKLTGLIFYSTRIFLPIFLLYLYFQTKPTAFLNFGFISLGTFSGIFLASKGVAIFYAFPVLLHLITKNKIKHWLYAILLFLFLFINTTFFRSILFDNSSSLSLESLEELFFIFSKNTNSISEFLLNFARVILNRLYGVQDIILTSQYELLNPIDSFKNFIMGGDFFKNIAFDLFGLTFLPGQAFGVGIGVLGLIYCMLNSSFTLTILMIFFTSLLVSILNAFMNLIFINSNPNIKNKLYFLLLFIIGFNLVQGTVFYLYYLLIIFIIYSLIFIKKINSSN
jgi:hypothetical protein